MKSKALLILTVFLLALSAAAQKPSLVGYRHKGVVYGERLPNGARDLGGSLLEDDDYGVTRYEMNGRYYLWLEKIFDRDREGVPSWIVRDVLAIGRLRKNQEVLFGLGSTCTRNRRADQSLIVLAERSKNRKSYKISNVWRANTEREKFEKASVKGVRCEVGEP